jgi:hypothetical protein
MSRVRYVECSIGGKRGAQRSVCDEAAVEAYPTWVFADGSRAAGSLSVAILAAKTGCKPPGAGAPENVERTDADGLRHRKVGGALIIDVPE